MAEDANAQIRIDIDTTAALASIKNLQRQISAFHSQMLSSGNAANAAMSRNMQKNLIDSINATGKFSANLSNIKSTTESFTNSLEKNKLGMREYFRYAGGATQTFGRLFKSEFDTVEKVARERVKTLQTQYIKMGRDANGAIQSIQVRPLALDMDNLATRTAMAAQKQQILNQLIKQGTTNLVNWGKNTQWAGRQLMVGFTLPLTVLGGIAAKSFMELEKQAVRFKRVYGEMFTTSADTEKALSDVKDLANEFTKYGVAVEKTLGLAADLAQQGLAGVELLAQVSQATRLAVLGEVDQQEALKATVSITNAFGIAAEDLASKINFLNAVENQTITAIEDLTIAIPKAGPVVRQLGGDVEDLAFFLTAMKEGGINASEGANALKSGLASLINPSEKSSQFLANLGINIKSIVEANKGDVKGIVINFAQALDQLDPLNRARAIEQLFGKFQFSRLSTLFQNVIKEGNQASRVLTLSKQTAEELAVLAERELKRVEDSPAFKFQKAIEDITVSLAPLGEQFLKLVTPIVEFVTGMLKRFNEMSEGSKTFITGLIATFGLIAPVVLMAVGLVANGVGSLIKGFNQIRLFYQKLAGGSRGLADATQYMTQEQLEAAAVAASLGQSHAQLAQIFTSETKAIQGLIAAYQQAVVAANALNAVQPVARVRPPTVVTANARGGKRAVSPAGPPGFAKGILSVPGPKGAGDIIAAMLSPGEAVIPAKQTKKYGALIAGIISDKIPGYKKSNVEIRGTGFGFTPEQGKVRQSYRDYNAGRNRSIEEAVSLIDSKAPGRGSNLANRLAQSGVSAGAVRKLFSEATQLAEQSIKQLDEFESILFDKIDTAKKNLKGFVSSSGDLVKEVRQTTGYTSSNAGAGEFAHIGEGSSYTAKELLEMDKAGKFPLTDARRKALQAQKPDTAVQVKSGLGMQGFGRRTNAKLAGSGVDASELSQEFDSLGYEKWQKSIELGGGNIESLADQTKALDEEMSRLIKSVPQGTKIFDTMAQAQAYQIKTGLSARSIEDLYATARNNTQTKNPQLFKALDAAQVSVTELRTPDKQLASPGKNRTVIQPENEKLIAQAKRENASVVANLSEQSKSNKDLSITSDRATQDTGELRTAVNAFGLEAKETAAQAVNAINTLNSAQSRRGSRRASSPGLRLASGTLSVPGPKGAGDVVPAMLSPGEAVIPAKLAKKYAPFIQDMISGNIPGFFRGGFIGMPKSSKAVSKNRTAADEIYQLFKKSSYANTPPTEYGHQISPTSGHSFPIFGLGGVYQKGNKQVFVKPVMDEKAALAEMRATTIARQAHGLKAPTQRIVVMRDPMDVKRQRRFLALESDLDPTFINDKPMGVFNEEQYFRQLTASLLRADKDLSAANVYEDVVADVGPAGVFDRASGLRDYSKNLPSMEEQALINLLGIKGGAKRAFAESTLGLMAGLTPQQYKQKMLGEIQRVLPKLKQTIASFKLTNPTDVGMYDDMTRRLEAGLTVDWTKFHTLHSGLKIPTPKKPKAVEPIGYKRGVVSVPGPKGKGDVVPAMLSPGEAVIPTKMAKRYSSLISSMIAGSIPGYELGYDPQDPFRTPISSPPPTGKLAPPPAPDVFGGYDGTFDYSESEEDKKAKKRGKLFNKEAFAPKAIAEGAKGMASGVKSFFTHSGADSRSDRAIAAVDRTMDKFEKTRLGKFIDAKSEQNQQRKEAARQAQNSTNTQGASKNTTVVAASGQGGQAVDDDGRPLTKKEQAKQGFQRFGGRVSQVGMTTSMAAGMATMVPGAVGETAQQIAPAIMAVSSLAMFIQGPVSGAFVALAAVIGGVVYSIYKINEAYKDGQKEAIRLATAIGGSTQAVRSLAEFSGKATAGEIAEKRRENKFRLMQVAPGKTTFGESFVKDEQGVALLDNLKKEVANNKGNTATALASVSEQLSMAVVSGALTQDQAGSIASEIGVKLNDASFGVKVRAQITELVGPGGEDLTKNPLVVATRLADQSRAKMSSSRDAMNTQLGAMGTNSTELGRGINATGIVAAGAGVGAGIGAAIGSAIVPGLGTAIGAVVGTIGGSIAGVVSATALAEEQAKKAGAYSGAYVADVAMALQKQNEIGAVLDQTYAVKLAEAEAEGDITKYKELQLAYDKERLALTQVSSDLSNSLVEDYDSMIGAGNTAGAEAVLSGVKNAAEVKYQDDPTFALYKDSINASIKAGTDSGAITGGQEVLIRTQLLSGMDPATLNSLLNAGDIETTVDIIANLGGPMATEVGMLTNMIKDKEVAANFMLKVKEVGSDSAEAQKLIDLAATIQGLGGVMENSIDTVFTTLMDSDQSSEELQDFMLNMDAAKVDTVEMAYEVVPEFNVDGKWAEAFNEEYFATLKNNVEKETYMVASRIIMEIPEAELIASADFQNWLGDEGAKYGKFPGENSYAQWQAWYADSSAQKVTTSGVALSGALKPKTPKKTGGGGGPQASPLDDLLKKLRDVRKNQIEVTKGFDASAKALDKLFGGKKSIKAISGLEQDMRRLGAGEDLISLIAGMDSEEFEKRKGKLFSFDKETGEITGFKRQLKNIGEALSSIAIGQFVSDQQGLAANSRNQAVAFNMLTAAGYGTADALELVQNAQVALAIATGKATKKQIRNMIAELQNAQAQAKAFASSTAEGAQEIFNDGFSKAMEAFDVQEKKLTLEFELKTKGDQKLLETAENEIAKIQYKIDDFEADLKGIEDQETKINKTYDDKLDALEKVKKLNQSILDQEKGKLSVAEAITRGDLAAAAQAAQEVRSQSAAGYFDSQTDAFQAAREKALGQVRGSGGKSRIQIEEEIKKLSNEIFYIEEKTLEPAAERIRLARVQLEENIKSITVLNRTRFEWETIKSNIDLARVNSVTYKQSITEALGIVERLKALWDGISSKTVTLTINEERSGGGGGGGGGGGDGGGGGKTDDAWTSFVKNTDPKTATVAQLTGLIKDKRSAAEASRELASRAGAGGSADRTERQINNFVDKSMGTNRQGPPSGVSLRALMRNTGGIVPAYLRMGGLLPYKSEGGQIFKPLGTDTVPAMLTPGEFVLRKSVVDKLGVDRLNALNSGSMFLTPRSFSQDSFGSSGNSSVIFSSSPQTQAVSNSSVYNYNLSVNVASMSDPNAIAQTVMGQIRQIDSQRLRGNRF